MISHVGSDVCQRILIFASALYVSRVHSSGIRTAILIQKSVHNNKCALINSYECQLPFCTVLIFHLVKNKLFKDCLNFIHFQVGDERIVDLIPKLPVSSQLRLRGLCQMYYKPPNDR